jgi:hypothetical protein
MPRKRQLQWLQDPVKASIRQGLRRTYAREDLSYLRRDTEAGVWLEDNCWKYGFVVRYPEEKSDITRITYEPWHLRYVGEEQHAEIMEENGWCLEEYIEEYSK